MGTTALNMHERMDGLLYALVHPQKPMVTTRVLDLVHFDQVQSRVRGRSIVIVACEVLPMLRCRASYEKRLKYGS